MPEARPSLPQGISITKNILKRPTVITILAALNYTGAGFSLIASIVFFVLASGQIEARMILGAVAIFFLGSGVLSLFCAHGLWNLKSHGRTIQIAFSILGLLGFPLGTAVSILVLIYLFKPEVKILFSGRTPAQISPSEKELLRKFESNQSSAAVLVVAIGLFFFVAIAITGIVAAIAIPNLLNAIQRAKQKRTMVDMRAIATAMEGYATDNGMYPESENADDLAKKLEPKYIKSLPLKDGWNHEFHLYTWKDTSGASGPDSYVIISGGKDGEFENDSVEEYKEGPTQSFNNDIVYSNGSFIQYPEVSGGKAP